MAIADDDFEDLSGIPRKAGPVSDLDNFVKVLFELRRDIDQALRLATLRNASIGGGDGLRILDSAGKTRAWLRGDGGAVVICDPDEQEVVRLGPLDATAPGEFGVEARDSFGNWVRLGSQTTSWDNIAGKPSDYPATDHVHVGEDITGGTVPNALTAGSAVNAQHAADADGTEYGFNNTVSGTTFYALWVGNDGGFHFGRNTSSRRYKKNIRDAELDPQAILRLRPVIFDRRSKKTGQPARTDEFGLIAEEVEEVLPQVVTYYEDKVDGISYDLLPVAMVPLLKQQQERIDALERRLHNLESGGEA